MSKPNKPEDQNQEWKSSWRDEYFKWLCGYANVKGGHLFIGVNDDGFVVGVRNFRKLLEDLPNQIKSNLGIIGSVLYHCAERRGVNIRYGTDGTPESNNRIPEDIRNKGKNKYALGTFVPETEKQKEILARWEKEEPVIVNPDGTLDYLEIVIDSYPHMVSYNGKVYKRSGSTLQELNGIELEKFVLERSGRRWDEVVMPDAKISDLSREALQLFREKSARKGRRTDDQLSVSDNVLLEDLKAVDTQDRLYRASLLLFHPDPERYVTGAYIKIGFFGRPGEYGENRYEDVIYHDDIRGPLIKQIDDAVETIYTKYMKALISYDGLQRIENYFWPKEAFREVLLNAVINKEYHSGNPIQIKVYDDKISVFNEGHWPVSKLAVADVYKTHSSYPENPKLASLFFESGEIEAWGSGFSKIKEECSKANAPLPVIDIGEGDTPDKGITVCCNASETYKRLQRGDGKRVNQGTKSELAGNGKQEDPAHKSIIRMQEVLSASLTDREKAVILPIAEYLTEHDSVTTRIAAELTGKSTDTALRYLKKMEALDVLERKGKSSDTVFSRKQ